MNKLEQAARHALEALETAFSQTCSVGRAKDWKDIQEAITAMREALSEQAEQEPVADYAYQSIEEYEDICGMQVNDAFKIGWDMARTTNAMLGIKAAPVEPVKHEPVAWWNGKETAWFEHELCGWQAPDGCTIPLYAAPVSVEVIRAEALEEAAKVCRTAQAQGLQSIREAIEEAIRELK